MRLWVTGACFVASLASAQMPAQQAKTLSTLIAEQKARDAETAAGIASSGQLLYNAEANKKSWGQYCEASQALSDRGEFRRAIREASKALHLGQTEGNPAARAYAMRDLAYAYSLAGDLDKAAQWASQSIPASKAISNPNVNVANEIESPVHKILGDIAARRGQHDEALREYQASIDAASFFSSQKAMARIAMGAVELRRGNAPRAREILSKEIDNSSDDLAATARRGLADSYLAERKPKEALEQFTRAADLASGARNAYSELWARYGMARASLALGEKSAAAVEAARAIEIAEGLRGRFRVSEFKSGFFAEVQDIFDFAIELAVDASDSRRALEISEQSRARAALDMLRGRGGAARSQAAEAVRSQSPGDVAATLPPATVLVVYHVLPDRTIAWTLRKDATAMTVVPIGLHSLEDQVRSLRDGIVARASGVEAGRALGKLLIAPLALRDGETVVFVPHKSLHLAPLHALPARRDPLVVTNPVAYALSVSAAGESLRQPLASSGALLALGNPDLGDPELDLPASEAEVRAIARMGAGEVFVRKDASAARFRSATPAAGIVHVAAHATIDEVDPLYSALKLAAGDVEAREIYGMDLRNARLVALSACSSGMGKISGGDEFWGFKRSFLVAGAQSLLVTLWPVADESTARLMESFYRHRAEKPAAEALRLAQLDVMRSPQDQATLFWAPFILVGDWR